MANILDYIKEQGHLTFDLSPLNEVDNLIFSEISYLNFADIVQDVSTDEIILKDAAHLYFKKDRGNFGKALLQNQEELLRLMSESKRFNEIKLLRYSTNLSLAHSIQFAALTFNLGNNEFFVTYRGTDGTLVGWKEDLEMSVLNIIPSQTAALNYFNWLAADYPNPKFYLGGHSKGGNLAIYAATYASDDLKKRILKVFNNDGPGFKEDVLGSPEFKTIEQRVFTFVPQTSIIGMLLDHEEEYTVVKSDEHGIMQHDGFSWEVYQNAFVHLKSVDKTSQIIQKTLKHFLAQLPVEERKAFIDALFDLLSRDHNTTLAGLKRGGIVGIVDTVETYKHLKPKLKKALVEVFQLLFEDSLESLL